MSNFSHRISDGFRAASPARGMEPLEPRTMMSAAPAVTHFRAPTPPATYAAHSKVLGKSMERWSANWWKWVLSIQVSENPAFSSGSDFTSAGNVDGAFFAANFISLTTVASNAPPTTRVATITANQPILLPVAVAEFDNPDTPPGGYSVKQLRKQAATVESGETQLAVSVDGISIPQKTLFKHREISPVFNYVLPSTDNILQGFGLNVAGPVAPAVADGYYVMLKPLSVGQHVIKFSDTHIATSLSGAGGSDLIYDITVTAAPMTSKASPQAARTGHR